jgi:hypothetical protein
MTPNKQGQICKIRVPRPDEHPEETYLITEDISQRDGNSITHIVSLTDLQRNVSNPQLTPRKAMAISVLSVVANDLTSFVESWNK